MLTFQDQYKLCQKLTGDYTADGLLDFKRDLNEGGGEFLNRLGRKFNKEYLTANLQQDNQYYQMSASTLRISTIQCLNGTNYYTPQLVASEEQWNALNSTSQSGSYPTHYFIRGFNEIGLYPIPSANVPNGLKVSLEPQHLDLSQDDFVTGTVTVNNGNVTVTHSASGFTEAMVGRYLQITDGSGSQYYRIGGFTSSSILTLENYYEGISGAGRSFRIGEIMKIPNSYQDAPVFFACQRFYAGQQDDKRADKYEAAFDRKLKSARQSYARSTSAMGVKTGKNTRRLNWIDLTQPVIYP